MLILLLLMILFIGLPFVLSLFHAKKSPIIIYRYFVIFNVVLSGLSIIIRTLMQEPSEPIYHLGISAILSMVILAMFTLWAKDRLLLASGIVWSIFVFFGGVSHLIEIYLHQIKNPAPLWLHIAYDFVVSGILIYFLLTINQTLIKGDAR